MQQYDVLIVGAGPAGSTAAKVLAEKGIRTLLLDKSMFPRDKPCGGGLPIRTLKRFTYLEENDLIESYSYGISVYNKDLEHPVEILKTDPCLAMVLRKKFDHKLATLAADSGAHLLFGKTARSLKTEVGKTTVILDDGTSIESQFVIGADGLWSLVAKTLGVKQESKDIGVCVFSEVPTSPETLDRLYGDQRIVHIHLQPQGLAGYGWVFPKKEHVNIGVVEFRQALNPAKKKRNLRDHFEQYLATLKKQGLAPLNLSSSLVGGGAFPTRTKKTLVASRVLLCGDAGGLVNPVDGEGIYNAMCSGEIAAKTGVKLLESNLTNSSVLSEYQHQWSHEFQKNLNLFHWMSRRWDGNIDTIYRLVSKDQQLIEFAYDSMTKEGGAHKRKWKIAQRFVITYCKERLGLL